MVHGKPFSDALRCLTAADTAVFARGMAAADWEKLRDKRLFVTGGTGFVGCWLLEGLLWGNHQFGLGLTVHVLTRDPLKFRNKARHLADDRAVRIVQGDMSDLTPAYGSYDAVVHAAAEVSGSGTDPIKTYDGVVAGTRQALALASHCGASRFLYLSSGAVYGAQPAGLPSIPEGYGGAPPPAQPGSVYAQAKRASEWLVSTYCEQRHIRWVSARIFALAGPYLPLDGHFALSNFLTDIMQGQPISIKGGQSVRSYLYGADLALWLIALLAKDDARETYNVGSPSAVTILDMAQRLSMLAYGELRLKVQETDVQSLAASQVYVPDVSRAATGLGLTQHTDLDTALKRTLGWARLLNGRLS